jgi:hypothetical protein
MNDKVQPKVVEIVQNERGTALTVRVLFATRNVDLVPPARIIKAAGYALAAAIECATPTEERWVVNAPEVDGYERGVSVKVELFRGTSRERTIADGAARAALRVLGWRDPARLYEKRDDAGAIVRVSVPE